MYTNIQQAISAVESAYPSLFTKEDVIKLLNSIDLESASVPSTEGIDVDELVEAVESIITDYPSGDIVNYGDVSFSLSYDNRIEVDDIQVDLDNLSSDITATIYEFFKKNARTKVK